MRERATVDQRFDPRGRAAPTYRVFRWQGSQRWMLAEFKGEAAALEFARRVNEEG